MTASEIGTYALKCKVTKTDEKNYNATCQIKTLQKFYEN